MKLCGRSEDHSMLLQRVETIIVCLIYIHGDKYTIKDWKIVCLKHRDKYIYIYLQRVLLKTAPCCELEAALGTVEAVLRGKVAGEVGQ